MTVGAPTSDGATFVTKVDGGGPVRVAVADNPDMSDPVFSGSVAADATGVAKLSVSGLPAGAAWWWQVEDGGVLDTSATGRFRTAPADGEPASFMFAASGDAGAGGSGYVAGRVSNHPVFDEIRLADPAFFVHMGDMHYRDIGSGVHSPPPYTVDSYRQAFDDMLTFNGTLGLAARQGRLFREVPLVATWDNHDYGFTVSSHVDSDRLLPHRAAARQAYQERMPHYPLAAGSGDVPIHQTWTYGRVRFVMLDVRSERDPNTDTDGPGKSMLGAAQKAWLEGLLASATEPALCLISAGQWITLPSETDTWQVYGHERDELVQMLGDHGWLHRMWMLTASDHAMGLSTGPGNPWGGFPVALFAALDATPATAGDRGYDLGRRPGIGQFGLVEVDDLGSTIVVRLACHGPDGLWRHHRLGIATGERPAGASSLVAALSGSHQVAVEARLVSDHQVGDDPLGDALPVLGGDVQMDATAQVMSTVQVETLGVDESTGRPWFPRLPGDVLAPYGAEVFVRRGVDLGDRTVWAPLGYFRLEDVEQDDAPDGPIRITGTDRMAGIVEADLLAPREFGPEVSAAGVLADLVRDVYPDAVIVWDDASGVAPIGRTLVAEGSRYEAVAEVVTSLGKIMFWDGHGILQVCDPPDETVPVWQVRSGRDGVLVRSGRRVSRRGVHNAVIFSGEGGDAEEPVEGVAVDVGPRSPTRWGGPFGKVPRRMASPLVTTVEQARRAAREVLRRSLGAPYSVDFGAVVNPTLRPHDAVRVVLRDGTRELHVIERLSTPLTASDGHQTASTRERTLVVLGSVIR